MKKIVVEELCQILLKESNQSGQFITAIELISDIIRYENVKHLLLEKVLQSIIDAIPNWIDQYRSVLDSILKICLEFIIFNKITRQLIVTYGLLKYLGVLIKSQFYGVKSCSLKIVKNLCHEKYMVERLYINSVGRTILEQFIQNSRYYENISTLAILLEYGSLMFLSIVKISLKNLYKNFQEHFQVFQNRKYVGVKQLQLKYSKIRGYSMMKYNNILLQTRKLLRKICNFNILIINSF